MLYTSPHSTLFSSGNAIKKRFYALSLDVIARREERSETNNVENLFEHILIFSRIYLFHEMYFFPVTFASRTRPAKIRVYPRHSVQSRFLYSHDAEKKTGRRKTSSYFTINSHLYGNENKQPAQNCYHTRLNERKRKIHSFLIFV